MFENSAKWYDALYSFKDYQQESDIILCLFSSIGYVKTTDNVIKTLHCFKRHLNEDGIIVIEPWFVPAAWNPDGKMCRMNISEKEGSLSILNFHYLVGTSNGVEYFTELHELGLFSVEEMKETFKVVELSVNYDKDGLTGRGLYIAREYNAK